MRWIIIIVIMILLIISCIIGFFVIKRAILKKVFAKYLSQDAIDTAIIEFKLLRKNGLSFKDAVAGAIIIAKLQDNGFSTEDARGLAKKIPPLSAKGMPYPEIGEKLATEFMITKSLSEKQKIDYEVLLNLGFSSKDAAAGATFIDMLKNDGFTEEDAYVLAKKIPPLSAKGMPYPEIEKKLTTVERHNWIPPMTSQGARK